MRRDAGAWLLKAGLVVLWYLAMRLADNRLGLPFSPAGDLAPLIGLDRPVGWWEFLGGLAPLGLLLMSGAGHLLARWSGRRLPAWDWLAYGCLPLMLLFSLAHAPHRPWALACGAVYLLALAWQTGLAARSLWRAAGLEGLSPRLAAWGSALLALALYLALDFWLIQAVTTCGDETIYLIDVDRLAAACGLSAGDAALKPMRLEFYWGGWSKGLAHPLNEAWLLRLLLVPGWLLAGRLGALAVLGWAGAASLGLFHALARDRGYSPRTVLAATWLLGFTLPLLQFTQHVYPAVLGVLGVTAGLNLVLYLAKRPGWSLAGLGALGIMLPLAKFRLAPVSLGLALAAWAELLLARPRWRRWLLALGLGVGALFVALFLAAWWGAPGLTPLTEELRSLPAPRMGLMMLSLPGMLLDQQFGLIAYAPWLLLGLAGAARFGRDNPRLLLYSLLVAGCAALITIIWRWVQWEGGFTPPGRFLAALLPVLALWSLPALQRTGRLWRTLVAGLALLSLGLAYVFTLIPQWRFHRRTGINNLVAWLDQHTGGTGYRFLPSFNEHAWQIMLPAAFLLALVVIAAVYLWRDPRRPIATPWSLSRLVLAGGACLLAGMCLWIVLGRAVPSGVVEAENLLTRQSRLYGDYYDRRLQLVLRGPGDMARGRVVVAPGSQGLDIIAARHVKPPLQGPPPQLTVYLDGREVGRVEIIAQGWAPYRLKAALPPGAHTLELRMTRHNGRDALGLDYLELR